MKVSQLYNFIRKNNAQNFPVYFTTHNGEDSIPVVHIVEESRHTGGIEYEKGAVCFLNLKDNKWLPSRFLLDMAVNSRLQVVIDYKGDWYYPTEIELVNDDPGEEWINIY